MDLNLSRFLEKRHRSSSTEKGMTITDISTHINHVLQLN